ncbi:uncharacterized protein RJT20DRAFT_63745 [Scheffersomyces xylosifermentans]|uniref:uncharacterized protein n=1 Tax=Scheffersomyces xylosifermentans TaxID=1304137 RepID=UPI00315D12E0
MEKKSTIQSKGPRITQRAPKSCYQCWKRRVKCNKQIPCDVCINRGLGHLCRRENVVVKGVVLNDPAARDTVELEQDNLQLKNTNAMLQEKIRILERALIDKETPHRLIKSNHGSNPIQKKEIDIYGTGVHLAVRNLTKDDEFNKSFTYDSMEKLANFVTEKISCELISFNLENLYQIHSALHPYKFWEEHKLFWKTSSERHLTSKIDRSTDDYLWMAIWYALLAGSLFTLSDELEIGLGLRTEDYFEMAQIATFASLECLHRGQFLRFPNIRSIQTFCVLATCFHGFAGVHLQNALLSCMIYIARALNLDDLQVSQQQMSLLDFEVSCRLWWILVIIDWLECFNRDSIIPIRDFQTAIPRNISDKDLILNIATESTSYTSISFNKFMIEMSSIKRDLYFENELKISKSTLSHLLLADLKLDELQKKYIEIMKPDLNFNSMDYSFDRNQESSRFCRFLMDMKIWHERLEINRSVVNYVTNEEWVQNYRNRCLQYACNVIELFSDRNLPFFYKKFWFASEHTISASIFLLVDMIITERVMNPNDNRILLIQQYSPLLHTLKHTHMAVRGGLRIIEALIRVIQKNEFDVNIADTMGMRELFKELKQEPRVYDLSQSQKIQALFQPLQDSEYNLREILQDNEWEQLLKWLQTNC